MEEFKGKTAVITGGAEGIGYEIAHALAKQGMAIVLADIDSEMLARAVKNLQEKGCNVAGVRCDTSLKEDLVELATSSTKLFGKIHLLISNAGVSVMGAQKNISEANWRWIIDVNLMSVVYGAQVFAPLIQSHGEGGHILNVASMAGMSGLAFAGPYCATKAAVVALSESWRQELKESRIGVSVLCPGFVKSRIYDSMRNRQERFGGPIYFEDLLLQKPHLSSQRDLVVNGIEGEIVGNRVVEAIKNNEFYIFSHPSYRQVIDNRCQALNRAFDRADSSPSLQDVNTDDGFFG